MIGVRNSEKELISLRLTYPHKLHGYQFESLLLEPLDDFTDKTAVNGIRLNHDESLFVSHVNVF